MSMFDTLADSLVKASGDLFNTGVSLVGQGILNNMNNNAAMDRQQQSQQGASASIQGSTNKTDATSKEQSTTNQNSNFATNEKGTTTTTGNTSQTSTENILSQIMASKNVDESTKSQLSQIMSGSTALTAGTAESKAALNKLLTGVLDPSKYGPEKAQQAAADMMKVASQNILQSGISDVLNAGTATGTFGSTAQQQISNDLQSKAALGATQAGNAVLGQYADMRNKETTALLDAIKAAQAGNQQTNTNQKTDQTGSTNTTQVSKENTNTNQTSTGTVNQATSSTTNTNNTSTGSSNTTSNTNASGSTSQTGTNVGKNVSASSNQNFDDWVKANLPKV